MKSVKCICLHARLHVADSCSRSISAPEINRPIGSWLLPDSTGEVKDPIVSPVSAGRLDMAIKIYEKPPRPPQ